MLVPCDGPIHQAQLELLVVRVAGCSNCQWFAGSSRCLWFESQAFYKHFELQNSCKAFSGGTAVFTKQTRWFGSKLNFSRLKPGHRLATDWWFMLCDPFAATIRAISAIRARLLESPRKLSTILLVTIFNRLLPFISFIQLKEWRHFEREQKRRAFCSRSWNFGKFTVNLYPLVNYRFQIGNL